MKIDFDSYQLQNSLNCDLNDLAIKTLLELANNQSDYNSIASKVQVLC